MPLPFRPSAAPALGLFVAVGGGILLGGCDWWAPAYAALALAAAVALLSVARFAARSRVITLSLLGVNVAALLAALSFGAQRSYEHYGIASTDWSQRSPASHVVGRVGVRPRQTANGLYVDVDVVAAIDSNTVARSTGRIRVTLREHERDAAKASPWQRGDYVLIASWPARTKERRNPFDFDYRSYLRHRRIHGTITVSEPSAVVVIASAVGRLEKTIAVARLFVSRALRRAGGHGRSRAVLSALLLGDQSRLDTDTTARFRETGLAHVLAVSGLHVLLVGMAIYRLLHSLLLRVGLSGGRLEVSRLLITTTILAGYVLLAGERPSMVRAVFMALVLMALAAQQRSAHVLNGLGVAGVLMLSSNPGMLHDIGFQLSFSAVAAIVLLTPGITAAIPTRMRRGATLRAASNSVAVSVAATIGTLPFTMIHFGGAALGGLLLNIAAVPLTTLALGATVVGVTCMVVSTTAGTLALQAGTFFSSILLALVDTGHHVVGRVGLSVAAVPALVAGVAMLILMRARKDNRRVGLVALAIVVVAYPVSRPGGMDVVFMDVGHGDAILVRLPTQHAVLVDTGGAGRNTSAARRTVLPQLRRWGIGKLDLVVVSHAHNDHMGGLDDVIRNVRVADIVHNGLAYGSAGYGRSMQLADSLAIPMRVAMPGETFRLGAADLHFIAPTSPRCFNVDDPDLQNECSVVMKVTYGTTSLLLLGDAEAAAERQLLADFGPQLSSDVIKIAHHGSRTSSTASMVAAATRPGSSFAVITAGANNRFRLPDSSVVQRWREGGATVLSTATGAVWLKSDGKRFRVVNWRRDQSRVDE